MTVTVNGVAPTPTQKQDFRDVFEIPSDTELSAAIVSERSASATLSNKTLENPVYTGTLTGGTGVVNLGSGQFYKDASGAVGIGTAAPNSKLHVVGDVGALKRSVFVKPANEPVAIDSVRTFAIERSGNDSALALGYSTTRDAFVIASTYGSTGAYKPLVLATSDQDRVTIDASGNVGVGTASPTAKLDVNGDATIRNGGGVVVGAVENSAGWFGFTGSANVNGAQISHPSVVRFLTNGTERARIDSAGNLGLGVTPSAWAGYKAIDLSASGAVFGDGVAHQWNVGLSQNAYRLTDGTWRYKASGQPAGVFQINGNIHTWFTAPSGTAGNPISFTQAMTLDAVGRLGLGAPSEASRIHVWGNDGPSSEIRVQSTSSVDGHNPLVRLKGPGSTYGAGMSRIGPNDTVYPPSSLSIYTYDNEPLVFGTNNAERARIDASGNLVMTGGGSIAFSNSTSARPGSSGQYIISADDGGLFHQAVNNYYLVTTAGGSTSDATLKTDVSQVTDALAKVRAIRGVNFRFIEQPLCTADQGVQLGVIAQEIEAQFPEIVLTSETGTKTVRYDRLVAPLIEAVKELAAQNESLMARLAILEAKQ